ncbi:MAG TPA: SDR family oxidoreductase [Solirubrobacterales bacterium]|nr:SDR family oxidoreductase [Solirubrobacterales bacterium]
MAGSAPLGWDTDVPAPVARSVCFRLSDWSEAISGEVIHVDGGADAVAGASASQAPSYGGDPSGLTPQARG